MPFSVRASNILQLRFQPNDVQTIKSIADELKTFEGINHPNLVKYFGIEVHKVIIEFLVLYIKFLVLLDKWYYSFQMGSVLISNLTNHEAQPSVRQ